MNRCATVSHLSPVDYERVPALPKVLASRAAAEFGHVLLATAGFTVARVALGHEEERGVRVRSSTDLNVWMAQQRTPDGDITSRIAAIVDADVAKDETAAFLCSAHGTRKLLVLLLPTAADGVADYAVQAVSGEAQEVRLSPDGTLVNIAAPEWTATFELRRPGTQGGGSLSFPFARGPSGLGVVLSPDHTSALVPQIVNRGQMAHFTRDADGQPLPLALTGDGNLVCPPRVAPAALVGDAPAPAPAPTDRATRVQLEGLSAPHERQLVFGTDAREQTIAVVDAGSANVWMVDVATMTVVARAQANAVFAKTGTSGGLASQQLRRRAVSVVVLPSAHQVAGGGSAPCTGVDVLIGAQEALPARAHWSRPGAVPESSVRTVWFRVSGPRVTRVPLAEVVHDASIAMTRGAPSNTTAKSKKGAAPWPVSFQRRIRVIPHVDGLLVISDEAQLGASESGRLELAQLSVPRVDLTRSARVAVARALSSVGSGPLLARMRDVEPSLPTAPFIRSFASAVLAASDTNAASPVALSADGAAVSSGCRSRDALTMAAERCCMLGAAAPVVNHVQQRPPPDVQSNDAAAKAAGEFAADMAYPLLAAHSQRPSDQLQNFAEASCSNQLRDFVENLRVFRETADVGTNLRAAGDGVYVTLSDMCHRARTDPKSMALQDVLELGTKALIAIGAREAAEELQPFAATPGCHPDVMALHSLCVELAASNAASS